MTTLTAFPAPVNPTPAPALDPPAGDDAPADVEPWGPSEADDARHASRNADWHDPDAEPDWDALAEESAMLAAYEAGRLPL
jgi:hypothetical protein